MKLMDLFERYSGRLKVAEANAEVVIEIDGVKNEPAGVKWTSRKCILYPRAPLRTEQFPALSEGSEGTGEEDLILIRGGHRW